MTTKYIYMLVVTHIKATEILTLKPWSDSTYQIYGEVHGRPVHGFIERDLLAVWIFPTEEDKS